MSVKDKPFSSYVKDATPVVKAKPVKAPMQDIKTEIAPAPAHIVEQVESKPSEFAVEVLKTQLREEIEVQVRTKIEEEVEHRLEGQYTESLRILKEEYEEKTKRLKDDLEATLVNKMVETFASNNIAVVDSINKLVSKIESLQESIQIPTPIVQFTMPERNTLKKVHRDKKGNITHISEEPAEPNSKDE